MKATMCSRFVAMAFGGVALIAVGGQAHAGFCAKNGLNAHNGLIAHNGLNAHNGLRPESALSAAGIDPSQPLSTSFTAQTSK